MRKARKQVVVGAFAWGVLALAALPGARAAGFTVLSQFPRPDTEVKAVVTDVPRNVVYIAGDFTMVGGQPRKYLAAMNATTGALLPWNPGADSTVFSLLLANDTLYVAGAFTKLNDVARNGLGAFAAITELDGGTAFLTAFDPDAGPGGSVYSLAADGEKIYAAGSFRTVGGQARANLARLDPASGAVDATWNPQPDNAVFSIAVSGDTLYAGGAFTMFGGVPRAGLAAFASSLGSAATTSWDPAPDSPVGFVATAGSRVYVGGNFTTIAGQARGRFVAFHAADGTLDTTFDPEANGQVYTMALDGGIAYVGGAFTTIGGESRDRLAALDVNTGFATGWNPGANNEINALAIRAGTVFIGGHNTTTIGNLTPLPGPFVFAAVTENAVVPPNHRPTVIVTSRKKYATTAATAVITGRTTDAEGNADITKVVGRLGRQTYSPIGTSRWSFRVDLKRGANKIVITATDTRKATSPPVTVLIRRK